MEPLLRLRRFHLERGSNSGLLDPLASGGDWVKAMVLGKLPVPGRPTIWIIVGQGPTALGVDGGLFGHFYSPLSFPLFLPLSGRRPDID